MMEEDYTFEQGNSGSAGVEKIQANCLKIGSLVMIKGHPCKVVSFSTAKTGKHGAAKAMVTGIEIFSAQKYECTFSTGDMVDAPVVTKTDYTLINIDDEGYMSLMTDSGEIKQDLKVPEEEWLKEVVQRARKIIEQDESDCVVTVIRSMNREMLITSREISRN